MFSAFFFLYKWGKREDKKHRLIFKLHWRSQLKTWNHNFWKQTKNYWPWWCHTSWHGWYPTRLPCFSVPTLCWLKISTSACAGVRIMGKRQKLLPKTLHHPCAVISVCQSICATLTQFCHLVNFNYCHKHGWGRKHSHYPQSRLNCWATSSFPQWHLKWRCRVVPCHLHTG